MYGATAGTPDPESMSHASDNETVVTPAGSNTATRYTHLIPSMIPVFLYWFCIRSAAAMFGVQLQKALASTMCYSSGNHAINTCSSSPVDTLKIPYQEQISYVRVAGEEARDLPVHKGELKFSKLSLVVSMYVYENVDAKIPVA